MTELEELVELILPELITFIKSESIAKIKQKELDNSEKASIHCHTKGNSDD